MKRMLIVAMLWVIPLVADSHMGKEFHCQDNGYELPCYDERSRAILYELPEQPIRLELVTDKIDTGRKKPVKNHFIEWFAEGVLVCGNIHTNNRIATRLLLDPIPEWEYGIYKKWQNDETVQRRVSELGNFYFCRYTLYTN